MTILSISFWFRLFGEGLVYFAAMSFSTFYHTCDEATSSYADFPGFLDNVCARLFVDNQVLQVNYVTNFRNFFCNNIVNFFEYLQFKSWLEIIFLVLWLLRSYAFSMGYNRCPCSRTFSWRCHTSVPKFFWGSNCCSFSSIQSNRLTCVCGATCLGTYHSSRFGHRQVKYSLQMSCG